MPVGSASLTVAVPLELDGPLLVTVILYRPLPPAINAPTVVLATDRSKEVETGVTGVMMGPLPPPQVGHSFGFEIETWLPGRLPVTFGATVTSRKRTLAPPDGMGFALVHRTLGTAPVQVQPGVEPPLTL